MIRSELTGRVTRRAFLGLGACAASLTLVAACASQTAPSPTQQPATAAPSAPTTVPTKSAAQTAQPGAGPTAAAVTSKEKVTLAVWNTNWGENFNNLMQKAGDTYASANPNVTIQWQFLPQIEQKLLTSYAAGNPPDTHYTNYTFQGTLNYKNVLRSLSAYVQDAGLTRNDFITAVWDPCTFKGQLLALPGGSDWIVNFYNKDMLTEVGLDPEKPPRSFQEVSEVSGKLLKKDGSGNIVRLGFWPTEFIHVLFLFGGKLYDEQNQKITPTDPKVIEALQWQADLGKTLDMSKVDAFWTGQPGTDKPGSPFATNREALYWSGFWERDLFDRYAPKLNYGLTYLPTPTGAIEEISNQQLPWWSYAIPTKAGHPDQAWLFDKFILIDQGPVVDEYKGTIGTGLIRSLAQWESGVKNDIGPQNRMTPYLGIYTDIARRARNYFPSIPVASLYSDQLDRAFQQAVHGQKAPEQALQEVYNAVQPELEKALKASG